MDYLLDTLLKVFSLPFYAQEASRPMDIQPESHSRISTRINLFEEIFNTLKNGYSNENLRYAFSMFHFYLGTLRYIQQFPAMQLQIMMQQKMKM